MGDNQTSARCQRQVQRLGVYELTRRLSHAHGLSIGIASYTYYNRLQNTLNDARDISDVLKDPELCAYPPEQVRLLLDAEATRKNIITSLEDLANSTTADSTVFIFYAGHGMHIDSGPLRGEYLLPVDAEALDGTVAYHKSAISGEEFGVRLKAINARKMIVVLDCCHAEGVGLLRDGAGYELREGLSDAYLSRLAMGSGRVVLAAAGSNEAAADGKGKNGLFTSYLLEGLRGSAGGNDEFIHIFDLYNYIQPRVVKERPNQNPVFKAELREDFVVAMRLGGRGVGLSTPPKNSSRSLDSYTRAEVYRLLCVLLPAQFEEILFLLKIPVHNLPAQTAPQSMRASELIKLVEQPSGIGLASLVEMLPFR